MIPLNRPANDENITKTKTFKVMVTEAVFLISWSLSYYLLIPYMTDFDAKFFGTFIALPATIIFAYYAWFKKRTPKKPKTNTKESIPEWK